MPSVGDPLWLSFLAFGAAGLVLLSRARFVGADKGRLIESGQAALVVAAFGLILLFYPTLEKVARGRRHDDRVLARLPDRRHRPDEHADRRAHAQRVPARPRLARPGHRAALFSACDAARALQAIGPGYSATSALECGWAAAHLVIGYAAWMPPSYVRTVEKDDWRTAVLPEVVSVVAIAIQVGALIGAFPGKYPAARTLIIVAQTLLLIKLADTPRSYRRRPVARPDHRPGQPLRARHRPGRVRPREAGQLAAAHVRGERAARARVLPRARPPRRAAWSA